MKTYRVEVVWVGDPKHKDFGVVTQGATVVSYTPTWTLADVVMYALRFGDVHLSGPDFAVRAVEVVDAEVKA